MTDTTTAWWREQQPSAKPIINTDQEKDRDQLSFWAVIAFTFVLLLAPQIRYPVLAPLRLAMLAALVAVMAHVYSRLSKGLPVVDLITANKILLGFLAWILLTVPFSYWPGGSIAFLQEIFSKTLILYILLGSVVNTTRKLKRISWALILMAVPLALTTIKNFLQGNSFSTTDRVVGYMASLTSNPNDMALMLNLILPIAIALFLDCKKPALRILLGTIAFLLVAAIIATFSRAGFLTLGVIFLCYAWQLRNRPERKWGVVVVLAMFLAIPLIPPGYVDRINTIVNVEDDASNSAQIRLRDLKVATVLVVQHPLVGGGVGMNQLVMNEARGETWTEIHNVYLEIGVELGLPGLILFLAFYATCLGTTRTVLKKCLAENSQDTLFYITEGVRVSMLGFAAAAMFHPVAYHFYFYYIAGLAVAAGEISKRIAFASNESGRNNHYREVEFRGYHHANRN